jgi:hypothetical protein
MKKLRFSPFFAILSLGIVTAFVTSAAANPLLGLLHGKQGQAQGDTQDRHTRTGDSIGGGLGRQSDPGNARQVPSRLDESAAPGIFRDRPAQGAAEYRGYNGRTLEQAYYKCKYDAWRTAPPGDRGRGMFEKVRMRAFSMESCMNSEGFFRNGPSPRFDTEFMTSTDFFDSMFPKK